ncbi:MAG: hypothetical protein IJO52_02560 [Clostridia bacterium]|nr:hypothetical protein [Clostridia bacterium]
MKKSVKILSVISVFVILLCCSCSSGNTSSDNLFDFTFEINGKQYTLPEKLDKFTENGFAFPEDFKTDKDIAPGSLEATYMTLGDEDNWINVEIFNYGEEKKALTDCPVGRVIYHFDGELEISTAGGFSLGGKKLDDVISKYGKPFSQADYSTYTEVIYDKDPTSGIYDRYTFRFNKDTKIIEYVDITMFY